MVPRMKLLSTLLWTTGTWLAAITALHVSLNIEFAKAGDSGPSFRVGFLPVT
jgi:hypothetical protein